MIQMTKVQKQFTMNGTAIPILDIPHWQINMGEQIAIIGPSGSGKSTLLHLLGGILSPDQGEVIVDGQPLHQLTEAQKDNYRAQKCGYILQDFHLISSLTAKQNVEIMLPKTLGRTEKHNLIQQWFNKVGIQQRMHHLPSQLSRGQQQRVAIIRALINRPPLILADEPTGSLDWETAQEIARLLTGLCTEQQTTLITVTHDLHLSEKFPTCLHIGDINKAHGRVLTGTGGIV